MKLKLSRREKKLAVATGFAAAFFLCWVFMLDPLIASNQKLAADIATIKFKLMDIENQKRITGRNPKPKIVVYAKEEQLGFLVNFIDEKFKELSIKLNNLRQGDMQNKISVDVSFTSSYENFVKFLDALSKINTLYIIDSVDLTEKDKYIVVAMKINTAYR